MSAENRKEHDDEPTGIPGKRAEAFRAGRDSLFPVRGDGAFGSFSGRKDYNRAELQKDGFLETLPDKIKKHLP